MSKLFDALKRLEEGSDKRLDIPVSFASEEKPNRKVLLKKPWFIPLVCIVVLCALGFLSLFWVEKMFEKGSIQPQIVQNRQKIQEELQTAPFAPSVVVEPQNESQPQTNISLIEQSEKQPVEDEKQIDVDNKANEQPVSHENIGIVAPNQSEDVKVTDEVDSSKTMPEPPELPNVSIVQQAPVVVVSQVGPSEAESARFRKGLLSQAELMRQNGKLDEAATIYKQIWKETGRVEVANNLAATLMLAGREAEAVLILEEALKKAPSDEDLRYNLDVCNERIAAKRGL